MSSDQNDYNKTGMVTFVLSMVVTFGVMTYVVFKGGVDLKEVREGAPQAPGQMLAGGAGEAKPIDVSGAKEPWMSSDDLVGRGKQVYATSCAMCHGNEGKGDGPAGMSLNPKPRNFVEGKWTKGGARLGLFDVVSNGIPGTSMAAFKHVPLNERWALVHFIRSITQNEVKDDDKAVAAKASTLQ